VTESKTERLERFKEAARRPGADESPDAPTMETTRNAPET